MNRQIQVRTTASQTQLIEHTPIYYLVAYEQRLKKRKLHKTLKNIFDTTVFFSACSVIFSLLFWGV